MKYKIEGNGVLDTETGASIPNSDGNEQWAEYLLWVDAGNTADPEFSAAEVEATRVADIKAAAGNKIVELMPEWKQRNNLARMVEVLSTAVDLTALPAEVQTEVTAALAEWADIQTVRTTSDTAETDGTAPSDIIWPV